MELGEILSLPNNGMDNLMEVGQLILKETIPGVVVMVKLLVIMVVFHSHKKE